MDDHKKLIGKTLRRLRKARGWTQDRLIEATGDTIEVSNLSRIETGKTEVSSQKLDILAKALGSSAADVMAEALGGEQADSGAPPCRSIPICSWDDAACKEPGSKGHITDWMPTAYNCSESSFALEVEGDSMVAPSGLSLPPGTLIAVDPTLTPKDNQLAVAVCNPGQLLFRQVVSEGGTQYLRPLNAQYPVMAVSDDTRFIGVIVDASSRKLLK